MDTIYSRKSAAAGEVWKAIPEPPSYSAVRAMLKILETKGLLTHRKQGRKYLYLPTISHGRARQSAIRQLLSIYFDDSVEAAMAALIRTDRKKLTEQDYRRLIERLLHLLGAVLAVNLVKGLAVFSIAWAITAVIKNLSPASRHLIWFVVIASFLLLPLAWLALPAVRLGPPIPVEPGSVFRSPCRSLGSPGSAGFSPAGSPAGGG